MALLPTRRARDRAGSARLRPGAAAALALALTLSACASFSPDRGTNRVSSLSQVRTGHAVNQRRATREPDTAQTRVSELLAQPLTPASSVEIALRSNRGPHASLGRLSAGDPFLAPSDVQAAQDAAQVAANAGRAWFNAVAAHERVRYDEQVLGAADAASELAHRMQQAGSLDALSILRQQNFMAHAASELARARREATSAREHLAHTLGLGGLAGTLKLPERLPPLPAYIDRPLPVFDFGRATAKRDEATSEEAVHDEANVLATTIMHVRERHDAYRIAYERARRHRDEIAPLRRQIGEQNLQRYNGMLIGASELLADAQEQAQSVRASVTALQEFWIADLELSTAMTAALRMRT